MKFNWIESTGEHVCCEVDATDCLPSRSLLYFLMLTEHICIQISKVTFFLQCSAYSEDFSSLLRMLICTDLSRSLSFLLPSFLPPPLLVTPPFLSSVSRMQWAAMASLPSQCSRGLAMAVHFTISKKHKKRSSLGLWFLTQRNEELWS